MLAGGEFNINSPIQLRDVLFDRLGLKSRQEDGQDARVSTAEEVLEELALHHELPRKILEYRAVQKLKSTYVDALPVLVNPRDRAHPRVLQPDGGRHRPALRHRPEPAEHPHPHRRRAGASARRSWPSRGTCCSPPTTARSSCASSRTSRRTRRSSTPSGAARTCTTAPRARSSGRSRRSRRTSSGASRRWSTTRCSTGRPPSPWPRTSACSQKEAEAVHRGLLRALPDGARVHRRHHRAGARDRARCARCWAGCAACPTCSSQNFQVRMEAERQAMNTPVQGSAADLIKKAMIDLHRELRRRGAALAAHPADPRRAAARGAGGRGRGGRGAW